jgi:GDPmannose 4,6-dehydratase
MAQKIASAAVRIANGSKEILEIGDMSVIKEWTFAGDVVEGIWIFINQEVTLEANISSGLGYSILDWVKECFLNVGMDYNKHVKTLIEYNSPYKQLVSDPSKIKSLGFYPRLSFQEMSKLIIKNCVNNY